MLNFFGNLISDPLFITFIILFFGLLLGRAKIMTLSLGSAGVFLVGFIFGCFSLQASTYVTTLGLIIFMYALGIQAGPRFFNSLGKKESLPYFAIAICISITSLAGTLLSSKIFKLSPETILGIYTGTFNSSSSLAILIDSGWKNSIFSSYGIVYPLGLLCVPIFVMIIPKLLKKNLMKEAIKYSSSKSEEHVDLLARKFMVENKEINGKKLYEIEIREKTQVTISRVLRKGKIIIPDGNTTLFMGDVVLGVGTNESLEKLHKILGDETYDNMETDPRIEARQIVITNPSIHNVKLEQLGIPSNYHSNITRIWRSGIELPPSHDFPIELGDTLVAVGNKFQLNRLERFLGKRERSLGEVDLLSMSFGIAIGILLGRINIPFPGIGRLIIGNAGGTLIVGMFIGFIRRLGFITGQLSPSAKMVLKELGLCLFLAGIGTQAGSGMLKIDIILMLKMISSSLIIMFLTLFGIFILCYKIFKFNLIDSLAYLCGGFNSSLAIEALTNTIKLEEPMLIFATCYPLSLFAIIITSQIIALFLH